MASQLQPSASPLAPSQSPTVPNSVEGIMAGIPKQQEDLKEEKDKLDTTLADDQQKRGALKPPDLQPVPQPTVAQTDPSKIWGSSAMLLAGLGGLLTRRPLVTAMNAASKVFQAYKQNDQEAAKQAFDSWKASNENALKLAEFQQKTYEEALKGIDSDEKGALAKYTAAARAFQDETGAKMAEIHGVLGAQQHVVELKRLSVEAAKAQGDIEEKNEQHQALMGARNAQKELQQAQVSKDPAKIAAAKQKLDAAMEDIHTINAAYGKGGSASQSSPLSDEDLKSMSEQYLAGDKSVLTGLGFGNSGAANRARLQDMIRKTAKEKGMSGSDIAASLAEYQGMAAGERTLSTTAARIGLGAAEMQTLVPQVKTASQKLSRGDASLTMNGLIQRAQHETQDPELRSLAVRLQGLKSAYSQVLTRGGVPTDSARAATDELFSTKDSQTVLNTVLDAMGQETSAIKEAPSIVRKELRSGLGKDDASPQPSKGWSIQKLP